MLETFVNDPLKTLRKIEGKDLFSDAYLFLRQRFLPQGPNAKVGVPRLRARLKITQSDFARFWQEQKFERRNLFLTDGRRLSVIDPGTLNGDRFQNAQLQFDGAPICGDILLQLRASDWDKTQNKENVMLQVVLFSGAKNAAPAQLVLSEKLSSALQSDLEEWAQNFKSALPLTIGSCGKILGFDGSYPTENLDVVEVLLRLAGDARVLSKANSFLPAIKNGANYNQLLYERILEALGYSENKEPMRQVARQVPFSLVEQVLNQNIGESISKRAQILEALFLGAAGMLNDCLEFKTSLDIWRQFNLKSLDGGIWKRGKMRPYNFPERRLSGFAFWLAGQAKSDLFFNLLEQLKNLGSQDKQNFLWAKNAFFQEGQGYFAHHARIGGKAFKSASALIGQERSLLIWVNAFLPLALIYYRQQRGNQIAKELEQKLHRIWRLVPEQGKNHVSKMMLLRLMGARSKNFKVTQEQMQQGLLQLFQDFCDVVPQACSNCSLPKLLELPVHQMVRRSV